MNAMSLLGASIGALVAAGLFLIGVGLYSDTTPVDLDTGPVGSVRSRVPARDQAVFVAALVAGALVAAVSGWWAVAWLGALGGWIVPAMQRERAAQVTARRRVTAVAGWVETVRDLLSAASGIDEAITRSADTIAVSSPIRDEVLRLRTITAMGGLREGLRRFGDELADPIVDYIAATLLIASERSSGVLHEQLSDAATVAREQVSVRERVEASRSRMRTAATAIVSITIVMALFIIATQPTYGHWYAGTGGQLVLCISGTVELVGLWWMARLARPEPGTRIVLDSTRNGASFGGLT